MKLQHKRYLQRLAAACLAGTMALSMISCGGGQQGDKNLITSQAGEERPVNLFSPMEKTLPGVENVARNAFDLNIAMA